MRVIFCALLVALIIAGAFGAKIYNNADLRSGSSPGGTACSHSDKYDFTGNSRGSFYVGFPTAGLTAPVTSAQFFIKPARCANADKINFSVRTLKNASATFNEVGGINNACPFLDTKDTYTAEISDASCISQAIDVKDALNAALAAGNQQFVLSLFDATKYNPDTQEGSANFCNRFSSPNVEPHYNDNSNCGVEIVSRQSLYIEVNGADSTAAPTTVAPTTSAPTSAPTTAKPTTSAPTSNSCSGANVSGPNVASPARGLRTAVCSGNGYCNGNSCKCLPGFEGVECEKPTSSKTCAANVSGPNVASPARGVKTQPCNGNGECKDGKCSCKAGFIGADCEVPTAQSCDAGANVSGSNNASPARSLRTNSACSGNGYCMGKICVCKSGFSGVECEVNSSTTTIAPSTDKPTETANISGDNNAKSENSNDATKFATVAGAAVAVAGAAVFAL